MTVPLEELEWFAFAKGEVACPVCSEHVPVPIEAAFYVDDEGRQRLVTQPDMGELWSHTWTHEVTP